MRNLQRRWVGVLVGSVMTLSGCTYAAIQRLSLEERAEFHIYQKVMTPSQERAYLAKATAAERTAYLSEIGLIQRLQRVFPAHFGERRTISVGYRNSYSLM